MPDQPNQTRDNHTKLVPLFHFVVLPIFAINLVVRLQLLYKHINLGYERADAVMNVLLAFAFIGLAFCARVFALQAQDRVIRMEEHARWHRLLAPDAAKRIHEVSRPQLIALRFAPDEEVPTLIGRILKGELKTSKEVKTAIKTWRGDYHRL